MSKIEELIQQLCPNGVEFRELQELFITKNGYTPSTTNKAYWTDGTVPWFRMEDIRENGRMLGKSLQQITEEAVKGGRLFPANSIIVATSATIGEHALITVPYLSNQRFTSLALKPKYADRLQMKFVCNYLDNVKLEDLPQRTQRSQRNPSEQIRRIYSQLRESLTQIMRCVSNSCLTLCSL